MNKIKSISELSPHAIDQLTTKEFLTYIADLEQNVKINKELLKNVLMASDIKESSRLAIEKLTKEVDRLKTSLSEAHSHKVQLIDIVKEAQKERDASIELMRDKEKKFETYLMKCRQDLDERNRTIENQSKALEKLKPIVERYEQELEKKEGRTSEQESDTSAPSKTSRVEESEASVLTVEYQELLDDNDNLTKEVERANLEITRLRNLL